MKQDGNGNWQIIDSDEGTSKKDRKKKQKTPEKEESKKIENIS